jgi:hypothetical protein
MQYVEINSNYRDRNEFPLPSNFIVRSNIGGRRGRADQPVDPVSHALPLIGPWIPNAFTLTAITAQFSDATNPVSYISDPTTFVISRSTLDENKNSYKGLVIDDTTIGERRRVIEYTFAGRNAANTQDRAIITVDSAFSDAIAQGDAMQILQGSDISGDRPFYFIPERDELDNWKNFKNLYVYNHTRNDSRRIESYDALARLAYLAGGAVTASLWSLNDTYSVRRVVPGIVSTVIAGSTTTAVALLALPYVDFSTDTFAGDFIRIRESGLTRRIANQPPQQLGNIVSVIDPLPSPPNIGDTVEVLPFREDNVFPLNTTNAPQRQEASYDIELVNLLLPNEELINTRGGTPLGVPFVYVELSNEKGTKGGSGRLRYIHSNNPNAARMIFKATVAEHKASSAFIRFKCGMTQTVMFNPSEEIRFSVRLPTGEPLETRRGELYSPSDPNPFIQISALFRLKKK